MMCEKYEELTVVEKIRLIGAVVHCLQSDNALFIKALKLIDEGNKKGILDGVTFIPEYDFLDADGQNI